MQLHVLRKYLGCITYWGGGEGDEDKWKRFRFRKIRRVRVSIKKHLIDMRTFYRILLQNKSRRRFYRITQVLLLLHRAIVSSDISCLPPPPPPPQKKALRPSLMGAYYLHSRAHVQLLYFYKVIYCVMARAL